MKPELDYKQVKDAIVEARKSKPGDGWLVFVEAIVIGVIVFKWRDNALLGLAATVVTLGMFTNKVVGTIISLAIAGFVGWWAGMVNFISYDRWDIAIALGLIIFFVIFSFHQLHVKAWEYKKYKG